MPKLEEPLVVDESARLSRHEQVKGAVEARVQDEIRQKADGPTEDHSQVRAVAGQLRQKALSQVVDTEAELQRGRAMARVSQVVDYVFYLVYGLIDSNSRWSSSAHANPAASRDSWTRSPRRSWRPSGACSPIRPWAPSN